MVKRKYCYIYNDYENPVKQGIIKESTKLLKNYKRHNIYKSDYVHIFKIQGDYLVHIETIQLNLPGNQLYFDYYTYNTPVSSILGVY